eukprot:4991499-Amphidinium_carterae.1
MGHAQCTKAKLRVMVSHLFGNTVLTCLSCRRIDQYAGNKEQESRLPCHKPCSNCHANCSGNTFARNDTNTKHNVHGKACCRRQW